MHNYLRPRLVADQASRLRQLATPQSPAVSNADSTLLQFGEVQGPRFIVVSELRRHLSSIQIAWYLTHCASQAGGRCLLVDLAPSTSLLPVVLGGRMRAAGIDAQPLWSDSSSGRRLAKWSTAADAWVDVVAQPLGEFPAADQMPRICEQLVRRCARAECPWKTVILLSDAMGIPLDQACWNAADEIVVLSAEGQATRTLACSLLASRLDVRNPAQRRIVIGRRSRSLWDRLARRTLRSVSRQTATRSEGGPAVEEFEAFWATHDALHRRSRGQTSMASLARQLWNELGSSTPQRGFRQAS